MLIKDADYVSRMLLGVLVMFIYATTAESITFLTRSEPDDTSLARSQTLNALDSSVQWLTDSLKRSNLPQDESVPIHDRRLLAHLEHCNVVCRFCRSGLPRSVSARCNMDCLDNGRLYQACFVFWSSSSGVIKDR